MSGLICACGHEIEEHRRIEAKEAASPQPCRRCDECKDIRYRLEGEK